MMTEDNDNPVPRPTPDDNESPNIEIPDEEIERHGPGDSTITPPDFENPNESEIVERPDPVEEEKEGISETKEESGLISRPKPSKSEYAETFPKEEDENS
jgi:hypothetical protein